MQTALTFEAKKLDLMQAIMSTNTEVILDKVAKYFVKVTKEFEKTQKLSAETLQMMEQSREEFRDGSVLSFDSSADVQKWLESL